MKKSQLAKVVLVPVEEEDSWIEPKVIAEEIGVHVKTVHRWANRRLLNSMIIPGSLMRIGEKSWTNFKRTFSRQGQLSAK